MLEGTTYSRMIWNTVATFTPGVTRATTGAPRSAMLSTGVGSPAFKGNYLLLDGLNGLGTDDLILEGGSVPAAAEGFDQIDRCDHLLAEQLGG